jgi:serine/threonine-protein kinase
MSTEPVHEHDSKRYPRIGRYELLGEIASGGMATVYLGRSVGVKGFARLVAIKKLHPHLEREEDFVSAFLDEARLAARIRHPNVVPTLDVDDRDGLYIVMEYVEGDRLLGLLRHAVKSNEPIPAPISLKIATETLAGLHAAHELTDDDGSALNLVHRDVSPQNVLIGIDGVTKITDFGIAKAESRLVTTRDGQLKGKIAYMAPEQARGGGIDRRVDVFAMGILLWEMLTSRRLFKGDNDVEVLSAVLSNPIPSMRTIVPSVPEELDAVVMRALERDPNARYETATDFADAIENVAHVVGGLATTRQVAQYVQRVAGPKLESERERIKQGVQIAGVREAPSSPSRPFSDNQGSGVSVVRPVRDDSLQGASLSTEDPPPTTSKRTLIASAAATVVALVIGGVVMLTRGEPQPTTSASAPPHAAMASSTSVTTPTTPTTPTTQPTTPPTAQPATATTTPPTTHAADPSIATPTPTPTHDTAAHRAQSAGTTQTSRSGVSTSSGRRPGPARSSGATRRPTAPSNDDEDSIAINPYRH